MEQQTIVITKRLSLNFEKFKDFVYVQHEVETPLSKAKSNRTRTFVLPRDEFDKNEKQYESDYSWLLKLRYWDVWYAYTKKYLQRYFSTGDWGFYEIENVTENPLALLRKGEVDRIYKSSPQYDGYLYDSKGPVKRPWVVDLNISGKYRRLDKLVERLKKHPKVLKVERKNGYYAHDPEELNITYMPSAQEFNSANVVNSWEVLQRIEKSFRIPKEFLAE